MSPKTSLNLQTTPHIALLAPSPHVPPNLFRGGGIRAFDDNQARAWPGRKDPCNMAEHVQPLLQVLVDQLSKGNLTPAQHALAKQDLAMIATRCFCQGHVGVEQALTININGQPLQLDAVDLTLLLNDHSQQNLRTNAFEKAAQNHVLHAQAPQKIKLGNPEHRDIPLLTNNEAANIQRLFEQPNLASPMYGEMNELIRQAPIKAFNVRQQLVAKQVIDLLPTAAQGRLRNVAAQLIGAHDFVEVMRIAAHQKQLPPELQQFRDSCSYNDGLKKAIYGNPNIAARILGLSAPTPGDQPSNQSLARDLAAQIVDQTLSVSTPTAQVLKIVKRFTSGGSSASTAMAKQVFKALGNFAGFATQEMANVPSCFAEIECPAASKVELGAAIHANVVSLGNGRQAVAAMQPVHTPGSASSHLPAFYQMLASEAGTTVFDLRSNKDFAQGSFDYCPDVGTSRVIFNRENGEQIQITTLEKKPLLQAQSHELTVRIQVGSQSPKLLKVIQFKKWPDHGVITPTQLHSLRSLMNQELNENQRVVTHCRAGVGRTGTLLAYESLHHDLIVQNNGRAIVNAKGQVDGKKLLQALTKVVAQGRIERGPYFVQSEEQFLLLYETLKADLVVNFKANANKPAVPPTPQHSPIQSLGKQIGLGGHPASHFAPEPAGKNQGVQNWQSILDCGENVVEIISDPSRLVGAASPSNSGLGVFLNLLNPQSNTQLGNNRVLAVRPVGPGQNQDSRRLVYKQQFEIQYQTLGDNQIKTLSFTQFFTHFDGKKLTARQLNAITEQLGEAGHIKPKWLTSVKGVGRPSALLVAQAMREEIAKGNIRNEQSLNEVLDVWIDKGRKKMGPLFINSREQRQQLVELGKTWLSNRQD